MEVGFVGLGRMGHPMSSHVAEAGHDLVVFDLSGEARQRAADAGLNVADSPAALAESEVVCSSLPATEHVEEAYFGADGLAARLAPGTVCVDLSTVSIEGSRQLSARCTELGLEFLDAPVSGTSIHAQAGTLVVMAGGSAEAVERARPVVDSFSARFDHVGASGSGLQLKLITNRLLTTHLVAIAEAILSLEATDLSVPQCIELLRSGAVPKLLDYKAFPLADRDFSPQFTTDLMRKDLRLADLDLTTPPLAAAAKEIIEATSAAGHGDDDMAALITVVEQQMADRK